MDDHDGTSAFNGSEIAIIGMSCRLPGASTIEAFWRNLRDGVESLTELSDEELLASGVPPEVIRDARYVRRMPVIEDIEDFDAAFFGYAPQEATIIDPQHRLFLECAWEALEQGGYDPGRYERPIGVFTGAKTNTYLFNVVAERHRFPGLDNFQIALGNDLAAMATRVSHKLDLRGPSYALHTACSTSLVAVHLACQSLLLDECSMAIAGGAAINVPQKQGYLYQEGGILSPDGSCRTFDAGAAGSNFGNGVGAVLLKRLEDALADRDHVYAVIRGSATNNDGARKASFTAPGVEGQTAVLLEAMAVAGVDAEDISYIEAHGTATDLGDSIEMLALTQAFRASTEKTGFCSIASAKTNLGHLETAAGVAGLIKTALALERQELPPSLHFGAPNPKIDFAASPFQVNAELRPWTPPAPGKKRVAGVSSFGIGSTNAHVILEEPPPPVSTDPDRPWQLLLVSARSESARERLSESLARHLEIHEDLALADVAFTLAVGRRPFEHRRAVVARDRAEAVAALRSEPGRSVRDAAVGKGRRGTAFLFPGLGEHHVDMGLALYQRERVFREAVDELAEAFAPHLGEDLREVLFPRGTDAPEIATGGRGTVDLKAMLRRSEETATGRDALLDRTRFTQPALFAVEVAFARLCASRGVEPQAMIGYSLGEYVCAHLAGVLSLDDACRLVALRAAQIDALPPGAMLAVSLDEEQIASALERHGVSLSAVNGTGGCVAAGSPERIEALAEELAADGVSSSRIASTHAFHSTMMEPAVAEVTELAEGLSLKPPQIPYVSNVTGTWITAEEATDPGYWARHMVAPVRFAAGLGVLLEETDEVLLEVGPGQGLASFARLHPVCGKERPVIATMPGRRASTSAAAEFLGALGDLWTAGVEVEWSFHYADEVRRRVPLPTYPFERRRYWIDPDQETSAQTVGRELLTDGAATSPAAPVKISDLDRWLYRRVWRNAEWPEAAARAEGTWLLFDPDGRAGGGLAAKLATALEERGAHVVSVAPGESFGRVDAAEEAEVYRVRPGAREDYEELIAAFGERRPARIVHLWNAVPVVDPGPAEESRFRAAQELGFYSLITLVQALERRGAMEGGLELDVVSHGVQDVEPDDPLAPERSTALGPGVVAPQEHPNLLVRTIDVDLSGGEAVVEQLLRELLGDADDVVVVHRGEQRRVRAFERRVMPGPDDARPFRSGGVYLITGGLGGIGLKLAEHLATDVGARLVLTRRTPLPPREEWDAWLDEHGPAEAEDADKTCRAIARVREIEARGAEVLVVAADVSDEDAMRRTVDETVSRFGTLHGIIHAAGVLDQSSFKTVQDTGRDECELHFGPKVYGLYVLDRVLQEREAELELDFVVLFSSLSAVLGGLGYTAYATANLFMDHFASAHNRGTGAAPWLSVDWDSWHYEEDQSSRGGLGTTLTELAMSPSEGVEILKRLLAVEDPGSPVISTGELAPRIEQWVNLRMLRSATAGGSRSGAPSRTVVHEGGLEERIAEIWKRILGTEEVGYDESFFDLGGNSLLAMQLIAELNRDLEVEIAPVALFEAPTVGALARHLRPREPGPPGGAAAPAPRRRAPRPSQSSAVAVVGMSGRFPGAGSVSAFWENLCQGRESISFFTDEELLEAGADPEDLCDLDYVKARPILDGIEMFDAGLFGYSPREAEVMDPQHRLFLEGAWEALEDAGYDTERFDGRVGVYAGSSISSYMQSLYSNPEVLGSVDTFQILLGNEKDSLCTKVSYKLNLRGPSLSIQTFCSTSLVAIHEACQSLLCGEADMALSGGISIIVPQVSGFRYQEGGIYSRDGHVRAFDARASGMVFGNGLGVVVLKRLEDALADGDQVYAVIRGTAINNDGSLKAGYSAASIEGQSQVVQDALEVSGIDPATISYVETHGSGTGLGDPVEIAALSRAFGPQAGRQRTCAVGSVKTNVGHVDRAAGVTGLIKAVLALKHRKIPPSLHFETPNPEIDFDAGPFYVNTELADWEGSGGPLRAGVTSLGIGGTNAHAVLEEAPEVPRGDEDGRTQLLILSGRTPTALDSVTDRMADHLDGAEDLQLADVAFTLQVGRRELTHRRAVVARDPSDAVEVFRGGDPQRTVSGAYNGRRRRLAFLFPGQGSQYAGMGQQLYEDVAVYRGELDRCLEILSEHLDTDLLGLLHPPKGTEEEAARLLAETRLTQPALFAVEYAMARMWMSWGLQPDVLIGHSVGEYVAACLAGVFSLEDVLAVVAERGRLIQELPGGGMLSVPLPEEAVEPRLTGTLALAAVNAPERLVVSGSEEEIARLAEELANEGVEGRRLHTSHAFHSPLVEAAVEPFVQYLQGIELRPPRLPFVSCVTGSWITSEQATGPAYWGEQLRRGVRFADGIGELLGDEATTLLEVGPGRVLTGLARRQLDTGHDRCVAATSASPREDRPAYETALLALGRLWTAGFSPDWSAVHEGARRRRVSLPTYPFERQRYWVEGSQQAPERRAAGRKPDEWLFAPAWKTSTAPAGDREGPWLLLSDGSMLSQAIEELAGERGKTVSVVPPGSDTEEIERWIEELSEPLTAVVDVRPLAASTNGHRPFDHLFRLARLLDRTAVTETDLWIVTGGMHGILGQETPRPADIGLPAACRAVAHHSPRVKCRHLDLLGPPGDAASARAQATQIVAEVLAGTDELTVGYRGRRRWVPTVEPVVAPEETPELPVRSWIVTGGLAEPGCSLAGALVEGGAERVALIEPEALPPQDTWDDLLAERPPGPEEVDELLEELDAERALPLALSIDELSGRIARIAESAERLTVPEEFDTMADAFCAAHSYRLFVDAAGAAPGRSFDREELRRSLGVVPRFERFFDYLLHVLSRAGMAEVVDGRVTFTDRAAASEDPEAFGERIKERYPDFAPGIDCVAHCAAHYAAVFRGEMDPVSVLFPGGSSKLLRAVMETQDRYSVNRVFVPLMVEVIREAADRLDGRPLRILEIGAGDGNLTWELAEALRGCNVEYHFTDIGRSFVVAGRRAAEERGLDFMRFEVLDATGAPEGQGFERYGYDVVVAFDVVHATPRIRETMANLQSFLAPGGFTMILEPTRDQHWVSLIWGLADGWWLYADEDLRTLHPLLEPGRWEREVFADLETDYAGVFPLDPAERATADHSLLVVQQPARLRTPAYREMARQRWWDRRRQAADRVRKLRWLEELRARVEVETADTPDAVTAAVRRIRERWSGSAGVVHAAGPWNGYGDGDELDSHAYARAVAGNAETVAALEAGFDGEAPPLGFLVSPLAWVGAAGPVAAADLELAARAARSDGGVPWRSLVWGVSLAVAGGGGLPLHLGTRALAVAAGVRDLERIVLTHRPTAEMLEGWNRLPRQRAPASVAAREGGEAFEAPTTDTEQKVAAIWRQVLGVPQVGLHDEFFDLGGDSLITTQVHSHLHREFGVKVPIEKLFEELTVAGQSALVDGVLAEDQALTEEAILAHIAEMSNEEAEAELAKLAAPEQTE